MKHNYLTPAIEIEELIVEQGIATSPGSYWGEEGMAGKDGIYGMYDDEL